MSPKQPIKGSSHESSKSKATTKGGPQGAHEGGASRGAARLEPSHQKEARKDEKGVPGKAKPGA